jgi:hypothetical protein
LAPWFPPTLRLITVVITGIIITAKFWMFCEFKTWAIIPGLSFAWKDLPAVSVFQWRY